MFSFNHRKMIQRYSCFVLRNMAFFQPYSVHCKSVGHHARGTWHYTHATEEELLWVCTCRCWPASHRNNVAEGGTWHTFRWSLPSHARCRQRQRSGRFKHYYRAICFALNLDKLEESSQLLQDIEFWYKAMEGEVTSQEWVDKLQGGGYRSGVDYPISLFYK